ncbi:uncharacterized protein MONOS_18166 [Monocercomonoides exilis]|uniref:uncharacterized protein n=1 Tax=Monocercomonoides exilis TaxID=2049356 RepID=UPI00355ACBA8|nr:hypothetical protein MONOS_18165 [Monocercomonoides exilis]KAH7817050.1 hypothetical protein MONOS_18166 [Monocercomonoides exilis]
MWGCTELDYADEQDLLLLVVVHQSETIFSSSSADNASKTRQCIYSNLLIDKSAEVTGEASAHDVTIKSLDPEGVRGNILLNSSIERKMGSFISCCSRVKMESLSFLFGSAFSFSHSSLLLLADGSMSIADTAFAQEDWSRNSEMRLNCFIILVENGRLSIDWCTFASLCLGTSCVAARGGQHCSFVDLNISDMN